MKTMEQYAVALCQLEMLNKIKGEYFKKYYLNYPDDIKAELQELENAEGDIITQIEKFRQDNEQTFKRLAFDLNIIDGKIKAIEFVDIFETISIKLVDKKVQIDNYIMDAYKQFDTSWKLCVKNLDLKAVKKYQTEELLNM